MSKKILTNLDLSKNELQNARTHNLAAAPSSPALGQRYYNTSDNTEYYWNGAWVHTDAQKRTGIPLANLAVDPLARGNHTGTQLASSISDLASVVKAYKLSEFGTPTANIAMGGFTFTGLPTPSAPGQAAEYSWVLNMVQSAAAGIDSKPSCRVVATANITLSGLQTIDGITVVAGDRVLVRGQTTASQNGVYVAAAGVWGRAASEDVSAEMTPGAFWFVEEGTTYGKSQWRIENVGTIVLDTTAITINQFGAAQTYTAGNGLTLTGSTFDVVPGTGLSVTADAINVDRAYVPFRAAATFGDGAATSFTITHNLNTQDIVVSVRQVSDNAGVECEWQANGLNTCVLTFATAPALNSLRAVIVG